MSIKLIDLVFDVEKTIEGDMLVVERPTSDISSNYEYVGQSILKNTKWYKSYTSFWPRMAISDETVTI